MSEQLSKNAQKKLEKKQAKKEEKEKNQPVVVEEDDKDPGGGIGYEDTLQFGSYPLMQSQRRTSRQFTELHELNTSLVGKTVWVRARLFTSRGKGGSCFILLRKGIFSAQASLFKSETVSKKMIKFASSISKESVIEVEGQVVKLEQPLSGATQTDVEIAVSKLFVLHAAETCPIQVEDCLRPETADEETETERPRVHLKTRLDHRYLDLRAPVNVAIFRIQSAIGTLFREYLVEKGFVEIHTPKIIATASEGGASVFEMKYFDSKAYLAQSPQLYKQMAANSELERVFEIGPVFRAENTNTNRHMTEFMGVDFEMCIQEHYYEALGVMNELFKYVFNSLEQRFSKELEIIRSVYCCTPIKFSEDFLVLSFAKAIEILRAAGETVDDFEDLSTPHEKRLGAIIKERYDTDFYAIDRYPATVRPFYTMPCADDDRYTNSYDIFLRGQEISSGAQRIHDNALLLEVARKKELDLSPIQAYVDSFRYGSYPHAGCGIGLERVVMLYLGLHDIRKASMFPRDPHRTTP